MSDVTIIWSFFILAGMCMVAICYITVREGLKIGNKLKKALDNAARDRN